jgi:hypothetical protein
MIPMRIRGGAVKEQYRQMAEFCRSKIDGGSNDTRWAELAAHWDTLHRNHSWAVQPGQMLNQPESTNQGDQ